MKQMNKMVLVLALCVSTQAFGWIIEFDPYYYGKKMEIFTFKNQGKYDSMLKTLGKLKVASKVMNITGKVAGSVKKVPVSELKAAASAVEATSKLLTSGFLTNKFGDWVKKKKAVNYIKSKDIKLSKDKPYKCRSKRSLGERDVDPKKTKFIFYVITLLEKDEKGKDFERVIYADDGPPFGKFKLKPVTYESEGGESINDQGDTKLEAAEMTLVSQDGGADCPK